MKWLRTLATAAGALAAAILVAAGPAAGATKRLRPLNFTVANSSVNAIRSPVAIGAGAANAGFSAPFKLRPGSTITGMRVYSNGAAASRGAVLWRFRMGAPPEPLIASGTTLASPDLATPRVDVETYINPVASALVMSRDYLYYVQVSCSPATGVWAVDVDYTR